MDTFQAHILWPSHDAEQQHTSNSEITDLHKNNSRINPKSDISICLLASLACFGTRRKVQVGKDHKKAQSEKDSHSKKQGGKKKTNAAFTLITIRPRLVSWSSPWTNRDYRIKSYQIASHLDVNRDNRANRGKIVVCKNICHDYHDC